MQQQLSCFLWVLRCLVASNSYVTIHFKAKIVWISNLNMWLNILYKKIRISFFQSQEFFFTCWHRIIGKYCQWVVHTNILILSRNQVNFKGIRTFGIGGYVCSIPSQKVFLKCWHYCQRGGGGYTGVGIVINFWCWTMHVGARLAPW